MVTFLEGTFSLFFHVVAEGLEGGGRDWGIRGIIMMSLTSIVEHWTPRSGLNYNQAFVPELTFAFMSSQVHQAHIALSEPMTSIV